MRITPGKAANLAASAILLALAVLAAAMAALLGPFGLVLLGLLTLLVCMQAGLNESTPTWSASLLAARMERPGRMEDEAADRAAGGAFAAPLRFYRGCGAALLLAGLAGLAWQRWS